MTRKRNVGIELLREVTMTWIMMFHYVDKGTADMETLPLSLNWCVLGFAKMGESAGNCIFDIILTQMLCNMPWLPLHMIAATTVIFIGCTILDNIRIELFDPIIQKILNPFVFKIDKVLTAVGYIK